MKKMFLRGYGCRRLIVKVKVKLGELVTSVTYSVLLRCYKTSSSAVTASTLHNDGVCTRSSISRLTITVPVTSPWLNSISTYKSSSHPAISAVDVNLFPSNCPCHNEPACIIVLWSTSWPTVYYIWPHQTHSRSYRPFGHI